MIIVPEERLDPVFAQLPLIGGFQPRFEWGDELHLVQIMKLYKDASEPIYPLVYMLPTREDHDTARNSVTMDLSLVVATINDKDDDVNRNRWATSYENVLNPLASNVVTALKKSGIVNWDGRLSITRYPKYSNDGGKTSGAIDKWDAIRIDITGGFTINGKPCVNNNINFN